MSFGKTDFNLIQFKQLFYTLDNIVYRLWDFENSNSTDTVSM